MKRVYFFLATLLGLLSVLPMSGQTTQSDSILMATLLSHSDVEVSIQNDSIYPWIVDGDHIKSGNGSISNSTSTLSLKYTGNEQTEVSFEWWNNDVDYHSLSLYIDGIYKGSASLDDEEITFRIHLPSGEHVLKFVDEITTGYEDWDQTSCIRSLSIVKKAFIPDSVFSGSGVDITLSNDSLYPWVYDAANSCITNGNVGFANTSSTIAMTYTSDKITIFKFNWQRQYNYSSSHTLTSYVDGVLKESCTSKSYSTRRYYLPAGEHIVTFYDSVTDASMYNYSRIQNNLFIKEIPPLETVVLTPNSQPITFTNTINPEKNMFPWSTETGYIHNCNYGSANSSSMFSTTFRVDTPSLFSFEAASAGDEHYHKLFVYVNGLLWHTFANIGYSTKKILLQPGEYTIQWKDTIYNSTNEFFSKVRNIELSNNWVEVELAYAGTLGVEILHLVDVLNDVTLLKIKGALGDADWTNIKQMKNLVGLDLSEATITSIPSNAFDGLSWLSHVKLPEGITSIGEYAFRGTQIWKIDIPATVTFIGQYAFASTRLEEINFPENSQLKTIGYKAFYQCTALREFIMPNTVTSLGTYSSNYSEASTFYGCTNLTKLHFSESLTDLRSYTCYGCTALRDVILPIKVTSIGDYAFYNNTNLHTIDFPESLRTIGYEAFYQCGLDSVKLPIKLSTLGEYAFYNCDSLRYIELPSHISHYNVNFYDCDSINTIVCPAATPPLIASNPLSNGASKSNITLYVPSFALLNYKLDNYWYGFGEILPMDEDPIDWTIGSDMTLYNDSPIKVEPNVKLTYGEDNNGQYTGSLTVNGNETLSMRYFYIPWSHNNQYVDPDDPKKYCALINNSNLRADSIEIAIANRNDIWTFVTFPYDVKISDITFTYSGSTNYVIRKYDGQKRADGETNSTWVLLSQEDTLHAGVGYIMQSSRYVGSEWQYYSGFSMPAINNTNKNKIFINTDAIVALNEYQSEFAHNRGWNLIGNPYPSYYDTRFMDFNAPITIWDMDNSTYRAYSPLDDEYILCPGESFFVQCPVDNKNIVFSKEGRQINRVVRSLSALPAKKQFTGANASRTVINLALSDGEHTDKTRVVLNENATVQYDMDKDASKFMSEDANIPQLYTTYNDVQYAINERPFADGVVDLCTRIRTSGTYTITLQNSIDDYTIYLLDKELNQTILLSEHIGYSFVADAGESAGRFELHFKSNTTTDLEQTTDNNISPEDGEIYTIMGVQVKQATVPGIYIQNGKKFIVQ